jgi:hypothetical protein
VRNCGSVLYDVDRKKKARLGERAPQILFNGRFLAHTDEIPLGE